MARSYRPRIVDRVLSERLASSGAVLIEGPKACGKTSTAEQVAVSRVYLDRDDEALAALAIDPALVLSGPAPQLVDEWQLDPTRVWNHVRRRVDEAQEQGLYILTGSAVPSDDERRHTGAGRVARVRMRPMSLVESGESTGEMSLGALLAGERPVATRTSRTVGDLAEILVRGGWPRNLGLTGPQFVRANRDYLATVVEVDLPRLGTRRDPTSVQRLVRALARNTAMEHKVSKLVAEVSGEGGDIARSTVYAYLAALQQLLLLEEQPAWSTHLRSRARLQKASRTHFVDPSLAAAALRATPSRLLEDLNTLGLLFESLVVRDLRIYAELLDGEVLHYRDSNGLEVDAIVELDDGRWGAFEVKLGTGDIDAWAGRLLEFAATVDTAKVGAPAVLGIVTATGFGYTRPDGVVVVPVSALGP